MESVPEEVAPLERAASSRFSLMISPRARKCAGCHDRQPHQFGARLELKCRPIAAPNHTRPGFQTVRLLERATFGRQKNAVRLSRIRRQNPPAASDFARPQKAPIARYAQLGGGPSAQNAHQFRAPRRQFAHPQRCADEGDNADSPRPFRFDSLHDFQLYFAARSGRNLKILLLIHEVGFVRASSRDNKR